MNESHAPISCSKLSKYKTVSANITDRIKDTVAEPQRTELAKKLQGELDVLLSCPDHDGNSRFCEDCHFIGNIHKRSLNLIMTPPQEET